MGTDIRGWVEARQMSWHGAIDITSIVNRHYDSFACLFGVYNYANFRPIAPDRGLPPHLSLAVKADIANLSPSEARNLSPVQVEASLVGGDFHNASWISWAEIKAMDLTEMSGRVTGNEHRFVLQEDGVYHDLERGLTVRSLEDAGAHAWKDPNGVDDIIYRYERETRRAVLAGAWDALFRMMDVLANYVGERNVRLIVWFSS